MISALSTIVKSWVKTQNGGKLYDIIILQKILRKYFYKR